MTSSQSERKSTKKGSTWKCLVRYASSYWELMDRYGKCLPNVAKCFLLLAFPKLMAIQEKGVMCPDSRLISPYWPHWYWGESYLRRMLCTHGRMWPTVDQVTIHCRRSREHRKLCKKGDKLIGREAIINSTTNALPSNRLFIETIATMYSGSSYWNRRINVNDLKPIAIRKTWNSLALTILK